MSKQTVTRVPTIKQTAELIITRFEDLSNELLYEILDFLDDCYAYETFSNLNTRFNHLIIHSSLPLKLNFSFVSKATFQHRCNKILLHNDHRIISLHLSHNLLINFFFKSYSLDSSFIRLEALILENIEADSLISILNTLASLPRLFYLTIISIEKLRSRDIIYSSIIHLPVLKYCKLSLVISDQYYNLSLNNNEYSPIEYLVIENQCNFNELIELLAYTPQLNRLSCKISTLNSSLSIMYVIPIKLSNIYLQLEDTSFDEFQWFISSFSHQLKVLHVSAKSDMEFLNANRWEQLITQEMPILQKFSFQYQTDLHENWNNDDADRYHNLIKQFNSPFWSKRQWFFTHQHYKSRDFTSSIRFYSTRPYRSYHYEFYEDSCEQNENGLNLAHEIDLHNYRAMNLQFPRAKRLTLSEGNINRNPSFISNLNHIFSPIYLTELIISDEQFRLEQLLLLLHHFPNIHLLTISTNNLNLSLPQSETNRLVFKTNNIHKVTILNRCTLEDIQILNRFCPYLQNLEIEVEKDKLELIIHFLLMKNSTRNQLSNNFYSNNIIFWKQEYSNCIRCIKKQNINSFQLPCNHHLSFICCRDINYRMIEKIRTMIDQQILLNDYSIEYVDQKMYLWW